MLILNQVQDFQHPSANGWTLNARGFYESTEQASGAASGRMRLDRCRPGTQQENEHGIPGLSSLV